MLYFKKGQLSLLVAAFLFIAIPHTACSQSKLAANTAQNTSATIESTTNHHKKASPHLSANQSGVHFNDMIGTNKVVPAMKKGHVLLLGGVIQHNRGAIRWDIHQKKDPTLVDENPNGADAADWGGVWKRSKSIGRLRAKYGVESVIGFGFTPSWATRTKNIRWTWQGVNYKRTKDADGDGMTLSYTHTGESNSFYTKQLDINDIQLPPDKAHIDNWKEWVRQVVNVAGVAKGQPGIKPYANVEYFQVWNEGHSGGPFYHGSMKAYFKRIHLPAVHMIRKKSSARKKFGIVNKKVVYGGWLGPQRLRGGSPDLPDLLNTYSDKLDINLWETIDVLDVHYRTVKDMEQIRQEAAHAGYPDISIWQTEWAPAPIDDSSPYERDPGSVANFYSRFAYWALKHNPENNPDKYRIFYFTYWSPDGTHHQSSYVTLVKGAKNGHTQLTIHGKALQTMGRLFGGGSINEYTAVASNAELQFTLIKQKESIEAFKIEGQDNDRIVVAVHLNDKHKGAIQIRLPQLNIDQIKAVERVTPWNDHQTLTPKANPNGHGVAVKVSTKFQGPNNETWTNWDKASNLPRTFFINVKLNP